MDKSDNGNPFKTINQNDSKLYNTLMISSKETICRKIDTRIFNLFNTKYKTSNEKYREIATKIKNLFQSKHIKVEFICSIIEKGLKEKLLPEEVLNDLFFTFLCFKNMDFFKVKNLEQLTTRILVSDDYFIKDKKTLKFINLFKVLPDIDEYTFKALKQKCEAKDFLRRPLFTEKSYYSYLPLECNDFCIDLMQTYQDVMKPTIPEEVSFLIYKNCLFSHNNNEIGYHPIKFKTKLCINGNNCENIDCMYAHNKKELRLLFGENECADIIEDLSKICTKMDSQIFELKNNINTSLNNSCIDLSTYKTKPCDIMKICSNNFCMCYHDKLERRRSGVNLINQICQYALDDKQNWIFPKFCHKTDSCEYFHTKNELLYDYRNFRKIITCYKEKKNGMCDNMNTCPYKHLVDIQTTEMEIPMDDKENIKSLIDNINKLRDVLELKKEMLKKYQCVKCKEVIIGSLFLMTCKHYYCKSCIKKLGNSGCSLNCNFSEKGVNPLVMEIPLNKSRNIENFNQKVLVNISNENIEDIENINSQEFYEDENLNNINKEYSQVYDINSQDDVYHENEEENKINNELSNCVLDDINSHNENDYDYSSSINNNLFH